MFSCSNDMFSSNNRRLESPVYCIVYGEVSKLHVDMSATTREALPTGGEPAARGRVNHFMLLTACRSLPLTGSVQQCSVMCRTSWPCMITASAHVEPYAVGHRPYWVAMSLWFGTSRITQQHQ